MSGNNAVHKRSEDADTPEILQGVSKSRLEQYVRELQDAGRITKYQLTPTGGRVWLGAVNGPMSRGEYEATTARDNV
jgi:predicted transcriptional regulator